MPSVDQYSCIKVTGGFAAPQLSGYPDVYAMLNGTYPDLKASGRTDGGGKLHPMSGSGNDDLFLSS